MQAINSIETRALLLEMSEELKSQLKNIFEEEREKVSRTGRPKKENKHNPKELNDILDITLWVTIAFAQQLDDLLNNHSLCFRFASCIQVYLFQLYS